MWNEKAIHDEACLILADKEYSLAECFSSLATMKSDCLTFEDIRYWQEVEKEILHLARKLGYFGRTE